MTLPIHITLEDTFDEWIERFNGIIDHVGDANNYVLVTPNATPVISSGNVSINGTATITNLIVTGTSTIPASSIVAANTTANGIMTFADQSFAGIKTFTQNVSITATLTANLAGNGSLITSLNAGAIVQANTTANGIMTFVDQSFGGNKTFTGTIDTNGNLTQQKSVPVHWFRSPTNVYRYYLGANISDAVDGGLLLGVGNSFGSGVGVFVNPSAYVGIGAASASSPLHVWSAGNLSVAGQPSILLTGDSNKERIQARSTTAAGYEGRISNGTAASPTAATSGQLLTYLGGGGHTGTDWSGNAGLLGFSAEENFTTGAQGCLFQLQTTNTGTVSRTEKMRVTANGNLGIGTTTPGSRLTVQGTTSEPSLTANATGIAQFSSGLTQLAISGQSASPFGVALQVRHAVLDAFSYPLTLNPLGGVVSIPSGAKIVVQNEQDGGTGRGIFLWTAADSDWGLYMAQAGATKSLSGGTAVGSLPNAAEVSRTGYHIRSRSSSGSTHGFIWENNTEQCLMSLSGDTGHLTAKGHITAQGYLFGTYINASLGNSENPTIGQIWTQNTTDNYLRKSTPAHFISQLGLITNSSTQADNLTIRNINPTINFRDTNENTAFIHVNSSVFYILRGDTDATSWTAIGGEWPLTLNLTNNDCRLGRDLAVVRNLTYGGTFGASSLRYKFDVAPISLDQSELLLNVTPITYKKKRFPDDPASPGFIAEWLHDAGLSFLVSYDEEGRPDGVMYDKVSVLLTQLVQKQHQQIADLEMRLSAAGL